MQTGGCEEVNLGDPKKELFDVFPAPSSSHSREVCRASLISASDFRDIHKKFS